MNLGTYTVVGGVPATVALAAVDDVVGTATVVVTVFGIAPSPPTAPCTPSAMSNGGGVPRRNADEVSITDGG